MRKTVFLVSPEAPLHSAVGAAPPRRLDPHALRLGMLDNGKANGDQLLAFLLEALKAQASVVSVIARRKSAVSLPAPPEMLAQLAAEADFAVSAIAD